MKTSINRRRFLTGSALGGAGLLILGRGASVFGYQANEKLNVALIGVGGRGTWFVDTIPVTQNVVALCDVSDKKLSEAFKRWENGVKKYTSSAHSWERSRAAEYKRLLETKPKMFADFRKMLGEMGKQIDAVVIATPDHSHAAASAEAIRAGKHVFCEKPLTRTVHESRALRELARKHKVATQMGNQGMTSREFRRTVELIWAGALGAIREAHVWNSGGGSGPRKPPAEEEPVPDGFNWDLWLGPAAMRPYNHQWVRRHQWREFGTCQLGNWASHTAALAFKGLKLDTLWYGDAARIRVEATVPEICRVNFPKWEIVRYDLPARGDMPPVRLNWYNGGGAVKKIFPKVQQVMGPPAAPGDRDKRHFSTFAGSLLVGEKGYVYGTGHSATTVLLPEKEFADVKDLPRVLARQGGCEQEWFKACKGETPALSNFDYSGPQTEFLMLGNVATQFEGPLEYDPLGMKVMNNVEADAQLRSKYRQGWSL